MFEITSSEIEEYSNCTPKEWQKIRSRFLAVPPFDLVVREQCLRDIHCLVETMKLNVWLSNGTLLGAHRDNDFIPWDDDIDLDMLEEEFVVSMHEIKTRLMDDGFIVRLKDSMPFPKMSFFKGGHKIALGALHDEGKWRAGVHHLYPGQCYEKKEYIIFKGMKWLVPSPPEAFLTHVYQDWKTPIKTDRCEDYTTQKFLRPLYRKGFLFGITRKVLRTIPPLKRQFGL